MITIGHRAQGLLITLIAWAALSALGLVAGCSEDEGSAAPDVGCQGDACAEHPIRDVADRGGDAPDDLEREPTDGDRPDAEADARICAPLEDRICFDSASYRVCNSAGTAYREPVACGQFQSCREGRCHDPEPCRPGPLGCASDTAVLVCQEDGFQTTEAPCDAGLICYEGRCVAPACAPITKSYIGCEFWAADLDNEPAAAARPVVVTVANFNQREVSVRLTNQHDFRQYDEVVAAGALQRFTLRDVQIESTERSRNSFRIETDLPVTVHQFNPQNNRFQVYSNDASLLLPAGALGREYLVLGWPTENTADSGGFLLESFVTIVGTVDNTEVTIHTPVAVAAGDGFGGIEAGGEATVTLDGGDVLSMTTLPLHGADFTGMSIRATQEISVFAGSECARVPLEVSYCDHLEQQLVAEDTWGSEYVVAKFAPRGTEDDVWRVLAGTDGTQISTWPPLAGVDGEVLDRGQHLELRGREHFRVRGSAPILVGQFMVGAEYSERGDQCHGGDDCAVPRDSERCGGVTGIGDPAYLLNVPVSQYRDDYLVMTPEGYAEDYLTFVYPEGTELILDDERLDPGLGEAVGEGEWRVRHVNVLPGQHVARGSAPFGLVAYGYDCDVSYAYPAGMNLEPRR